MKPTTVSQLFIDRARVFRGRNRFTVFTDGEWRKLTWDEHYRRSRLIAMGLRSLGVGPGDRVCILADSRLEWALCDVGIFCLGAVPVPIYATLPSDQVAFLIGHSQATVIFVEDPAQLEKVRRERPGLGHLTTTVVFEGFEDEEEGAADHLELSLDALERRGSDYLEDHPEELEELAARVQADDVFTIIYTSGTTGRPKGVVTTHANYMASINAIVELGLFREGDLSLLFLPLAHAFGRLEHLVGIELGLETAFARSIETVAQDLQQVRPTILVSVPRIYEKAYSRILAKAQAGSPLARRLFDWSLRVGRTVSRQKQAGKEPSFGLRLRYAIAKRLVFDKVTAILGGRLRFAISGAAAIPREVLEFFHACGLLIVEGYGMTETSTVSHANPRDAYRFGTVGTPIPGVEHRIAEDGEVLVRGPNIMKEYYKSPEETAEALRDGWLHTGDIGVIDADGYLRLTDRKKDLFKTSGGKFVAPTPIESAIKSDPRISHVVVHGNHRNYCVALITLNEEEVCQWAREAGLEAADWGALVRSPEVREMVQGVVDEVNGRLAPFETVKKFSIIERDFSIEGGELTPTIKVRRRVVEERYRDLLDGFYDEVYR